MHSKYKRVGSNEYVYTKLVAILKLKLAAASTARKRPKEERSLLSVNEHRSEAFDAAVGS